MFIKMHSEKLCIYCQNHLQFEMEIHSKYYKRNFTMIEKLGAVYQIKSYGGESRKYLEVSRIKYLVLPKCGTKYQKVEPNTNLI